MYLTQILLCTFFCNSVFIPSWFLMKLWQYYSKQEKEHIQERGYHWIRNNYIIIAQKYYNSTTLSMWVVYKYMCVKKIQLCRNTRSNHQEVFLGKDVLKVCTKFTGEHPCHSVVSIKLSWCAISRLYRNRTLTRLFSCKFAACFQNTFL